MKKTLLLLTLLLTLTTVFTAEAQTRFGVKVGVNYSGFEGDDADDADRRFGFHAGVMAYMPVVEDFFAIKPEILYSQKGAEFEDLANLKFRLSYVDVPVLAQINAGPLYFEAGPQVSFRVQDKVEVDDASYDVDSDALKRTSFGYAAGIGLASTPLGLSVGVRYNADFTKLYEDDNAGNVRNSVFMLTLGYMFPSR
ncbi:hypothetical protein PKOR_04150 [Pontibacter korlensis]|uniref:Outer membrane protein beta-barrel domain-containing protein n=1 Tax=Pontibacter korlensis TaxID=400092 RepID=A0A0E3ZIN5_9BACT|nr:porin family protein [Pontibacter korlensis]AKD05508.1 hypothetical protein PKOR_04150 [Pontibacter korlensis]